jgi:hypothetical protein
MTTHAPARNAGPEEPSTTAEPAATAVVPEAAPGPR